MGARAGGEAVISRNDTLNPLHGKYVPVAGDIVMFRDAPSYPNQRRQYTVVSVFHYMGRIRSVRVETDDPAGLFMYDLEEPDWERLAPVKVGRKRK